MPCTYCGRWITEGVHYFAGSLPCCSEACATAYEEIKTLIIQKETTRCE